MPDALTSGRVQAIFVAEPALSRAKRAGARVLASAFDAIAPQFLIGVCVSDRTWAAKNVDALQRFAAAMRRASIWANAHHDQTAVIASQFFNESVAQIHDQTRATFPRERGSGPTAPAGLRCGNEIQERAALKATDAISPTLYGK